MNSNTKTLWIFLFLLIILMVSGCTDSKNVENRSEEVFVKSTQYAFYDNAPALGNPKAPVKMTYYYDYQCRWCKDYDLNTFPKLKPYIENGSLQIIYKDIAILGQESVISANAAKCIYYKFGIENFLEYHKKLYESQKTKNTGWVTGELLLNITYSLELDEDIFVECFDNGTYLKELSENTKEAKLNGITSTPSFIINDKKLSGSLPFEVFQDVIKNAKEAS